MRGHCNEYALWKHFFTFSPLLVFFTNNPHVGQCVLAVHNKTQQPCLPTGWACGQSGRFSEFFNTSTNVHICPPPSTFTMKNDNKWQQKALTVHITVTCLPTGRHENTTNDNKKQQLVQYHKTYPAHAQRLAHTSFKRGVSEHNKTQQIKPANCKLTKARSSLHTPSHGYAGHAK